LPPELFTILGAGFGTIGLIAFYMGKHYADVKERHEKTPDDLKTIRFEIRSRELTEPLDELYQYLSRTFGENRNFRSVRDVFLNATLGPRLNDLISALAAPISADMKIRDDWHAISSHYVTIPPLLFLLCTTSLVGIPLVAIGAYYGDVFWNSFVAGISLLGIVMTGTCVVVILQFLRSRKCKNRYRKARGTYVVDTLRVSS